MGRKWPPTCSDTPTGNFAHTTSTDRRFQSHPDGSAPVDIAGRNRFFPEAARSGALRSILSHPMKLKLALPVLFAASAVAFIGCKKEEAQETASGLKDKTAEAATQIGEAAKDMAHQAGAKAKDVGERVAQEAKVIGEKAAHEAKEIGGKTFDAAKVRAGQAYEAAKEGTEKAVDAAREAAAVAARKTAAAANKAADSLKPKQ